jgi:triosephosphate isomerase (TIM)
MNKTVCPNVRWYVCETNGWGRVVVGLCSPTSEIAHDTCVAVVYTVAVYRSYSLAQSTLSMAARRPFVGGNWKCTGTKESVATLVETLNKGGAKPDNTDVVVAPTALHLGYVQANLRDDYEVSVQNIWKAEKQGAYTGELTADIVKDFGLNWTIIGHSERRSKVAAESNQLLFEKTKQGLDTGLKIIFCIGESLDERKAGETVNVCKDHLQLLVDGLPKESWSDIVVAYEPVWAIGTGEVATPEQAEEVHDALRAWLSDKLGSDVAGALRIIYGGSVKPANAAALIAKPNIDGFLVGGCSLKADFLEIISATA